MSRIVITIPTWNEAVVIERTLATLVDATHRLLSEHEVMIEVADNASTDATREIVRRVMSREPLVTLRELAEQGKGRAVRASWEAHLQDADILLFMDADLAADLEALPCLVGPIVAQQADLVCGSRFLPESRIKRSASRELASRLYRGLQTAILHLPVKDAQCGFKAISAQAARELLPFCNETGWMFDSELLAVASKKRKTVVEIPVAWIENRDPSRRSALRLFRHGWGFVQGLLRIQRRIHGV